MKRLLLTVLACASLCACTKDLENRVDSLEKRVADLEAKVNENAEGISKLAEAAAKAVTITSVETLSDGYIVHFSDGTDATIKNGINGTDGKDGKDGVDGKDGHSPVVGVKEDGGVLYWTVDGEFLLSGGEKVPVTGEDGKTPQFKIEDGAWKVSFDGTTWEEVPVTGTVEPKLVMEETETAYVFTLGETVITIAKDKAFAIKVETEESSVIPGKSFVLKYTLVGTDATTHVVVESADFETVVDEEAATVTVKIPDTFVKGYLLVKAVRNSDSRYSAQYVSLSRDVYGSHGGTIVISEDGYVNW